MDVLRAVRFAGTAMETFACLAAFACCRFVAAAIDIILGAELLLVVYGAENVRDVDLDILSIVSGDGT